MFALFLLLIVALWLAWPYVQDRIGARQEEARLRDKIETWRALLARMPDSASAHEALGDALREAGFAADAVACYEAALKLEAKSAGQLGGLASTGLEGKLRLTRSDAARGGQPAYGETLTTRQQVCRRCGALNGPRDAACATCGALMPVDHFLDTLRGKEMRADISREGAQAAAILVVLFLALYIASWMPLEVKGVLFIATVAVLAHRLLRRIGGD